MHGTWIWDSLTPIRASHPQYAKCRFKAGSGKSETGQIFVEQWRDRVYRHLMLWISCHVNVSAHFPASKPLNERTNIYWHTFPCKIYYGWPASQTIMAGILSVYATRTRLHILDRKTTCSPTISRILVYFTSGLIYLAPSVIFRERLYRSLRSEINWYF